MSDFKHKKINNSSSSFSSRVNSRRNNASKTKLVRRKIVKKRVSNTSESKRSFLWALIKNVLLFSLFFFFIIIIWTILYVYFNYYKNLQDITDIEKVQLSESSVVLDRNWKELFTIFDKEKRTYVYYEKISQDMKNAIIAWEDKTFYTNPWVDIKWLIRAVYIAVKSGRSPRWTSTISQQLIKNMLLTNERKIDRKIKEALLAYKLNEKYPKEKILELYLNKISFGSNASWIEQAAKTFFGIWADKLDILQSSYLASLPKWPTSYSPYRYYSKLNWFLYIYNKNKENIDIEEQNFEWLKLVNLEDIKRNKENVDKFKKFINNLSLEKIDDENIKICWINKKNLKEISNIDTNGCIITEYNHLYTKSWWRGFLNNIIFKLENDLIMEYQTGRKDFILTRMLTDKYITFEQYKKALVDSIWFKFKKNVQNIKYPHFVFYVKEYLEKKHGKDFFAKWWLRIYTTLDPEIQDKAQKIIEEWVRTNKAKYLAKNAALISIDNKTWEILAYIWWVDYYNEKNWGNVDILTSKLQAGSAFKPLIYSLWIDTKAIWDGTPIYDLKTNFSAPWSKKYEPQNFDWRFKWKMTIASALNSSRNIPAIKMYFMAWWTKKIVLYLEKLWINTLDINWDYGPSLWLWTWLIKPLELAQVFSVFANMWKKVEITPILKIVDSRWELPLETKTEPEQVLNESTAFIMNYILSNKTGKRPSGWNKFMTLKWRTMAAKTWTSTDVSKEKWIKVRPRNLWTIWYTPAVTTVVWAWNTNWKPLWLKASWLEWAWPMLYKFMDYITTKKTSWDWKAPKTVKRISISKMSWLLSRWVWWVSSYFTKSPKKYDKSYSSIKIDWLCNGKITELTPKEDIKIVRIVNLNSINTNLWIKVPNWNNWNRVVRSWWKRTGKIWNSITNYDSLKECDRNPALMAKSNVILLSYFANPQNILVNWANYIQVWYKSALKIKRIEILLNWNKLLKTIKPKNKSGVFKWNIYIPIWISWKHTITIKAIDEVSKSYVILKEILVSATDNIPPKIILTNPKSWIIKIYQNNFFNLRFNIIDETSVKSTNVFLNWNILRAWLIWNNFTIPINSSNDIPVWNHIIKIVWIDWKFNKGYKKIALQVLPPNWPLKEKTVEKKIKEETVKTLTPEQKKQMEKLSPEQKKKIEELLKKQEN